MSSIGGTRIRFIPKKSSGGSLVTDTSSTQKTNEPGSTSFTSTKTASLSGTSENTLDSTSVTPTKSTNRVVIVGAVTIVIIGNGSNSQTVTYRLKESTTTLASETVISGTFPTDVYRHAQLLHVASDVSAASHTYSHTLQGSGTGFTALNKFGHGISAVPISLG